MLHLLEFTRKLMRTPLLVSIVTLSLLAVIEPAFGHHSFQAEYDASKQVSLTGAVTKLEWTNPHAHFYIDVKDPKGVITSWNLELASPNVLRRLGWTRDIIKPGDVVTVQGALARDGANLANARVVLLADGRKMSAGSSADEAIPTK
jgi:hypothetical protein